MHQSQFPHADRIAKCYPVNIHHGFDRKGQPGAARPALRQPVMQLDCSPFAACRAVSLERIGHISPDLCAARPRSAPRPLTLRAPRAGQIAAHGHAGAAAGVPIVPSREQGRHRPRRRQRCGRDEMSVLVRRRRWWPSSRTRRASSCAPPRCWTSRDWALSTRRVWRYAWAACGRFRSLYIWLMCGSARVCACSRRQSRWDRCGGRCAHCAAHRSSLLHAQDNYPEMLGSLYVINAPWIFSKVCLLQLATCARVGSAPAPLAPTRTDVQHRGGVAEAANAGEDPDPEPRFQGASVLSRSRVSTPTRSRLSRRPSCTRPSTLRSCLTGPAELAPPARRVRQPVHPRRARG
jgi:hypothetical protein